MNNEEESIEKKIKKYKKGRTISFIISSSLFIIILYNAIDNGNLIIFAILSVLFLFFVKAFYNFATDIYFMKLGYNGGAMQHDFCLKIGKSEP